MNALGPVQQRRKNRVNRINDPNGMHDNRLGQKASSLEGIIRLSCDKSAKIQTLINLLKLGDKEFHKIGLLSTSGEKVSLMC